jgi:hypothetical protein
MVYREQMVLIPGFLSVASEIRLQIRAYPRGWNMVPR